MENKKEEATYTATPVPGEDYSLISVESNMTVKQVKVDVYSSESIERIEAAREEIRKELLNEPLPPVKKITRVHATIDNIERLFHVLFA